MSHNAQFNAFENLEHLSTHLLAERGISQKTMARFGILAGQHGWLYPVPGGSGLARVKAFDSQLSVKYHWSPAKPSYATFYYAPNLKQSILTAGGKCWFASGEADVWALDSAGIPHVFSGFTEAVILAGLLEFLQQMGIKTLCIAPDLDSTGETWARKLFAQLRGVDICIKAFQLPPELGQRGDLGKAWLNFNGGSGTFEAWLESLPVLEIKEIVHNELRYPSLVDAQLDEIPAEYRQKIIKALGGMSFDLEGFSTANVCCPFHPENKPSASLHELYGLYCFHGDGWHRWTDVAVAIGLESLREYIWLQAHLFKPELNQIPNEARERLMAMKMTNTARILDILYKSGCIAGEVLHGEQIVRLCSTFGFSRSGVYRELALGLFNLSDVNLSHISDPSSFKHVKTRDYGTSSGRGRRPPSYRLPAPDEILAFTGLEFCTGFTYDPVPDEMLTSPKFYRAGVYGIYIRNHPGSHSRKSLGERLGVHQRTVITYDELANIEVEACYDRQLLTEARISVLPNSRDKISGTVWLEDDDGRKFPPIRSLATRLFIQGKHLTIVRRLANQYSPKLGYAKMESCSFRL